MGVMAADGGLDDTSYMIPRRDGNWTETLDCIV